MPRADDWPAWEDWPEYTVPSLEVYPSEVEPLILYGPRGEVLVSYTPPVGFARAIQTPTA
jgi:hypothetical protein